MERTCRNSQLFWSNYITMKLPRVIYPDEITTIKLPRWIYQDEITMIKFPWWKYHDEITTMTRWNYHDEITTINLPRWNYHDKITTMNLPRWNYNDKIPTVKIPRWNYHDEITMIKFPGWKYHDEITTMNLSHDGITVRCVGVYTTQDTLYSTHRVVWLPVADRPVRTRQVQFAIGRRAGGCAVSLRLIPFDTASD